MAWSAENVKLNVDTVLGTPADGDWINLLPGEKAHYLIKRVDATPVDRWIVEIIRSTNSAVGREGGFMRRWILEPTELGHDFVITGAFAFKIRIRSGEASPTENIETDHYWRLDGVNI